ncbi:hypothetical protein ACEQPO_05995 [Bacillus sp. SL00103]
MWSKKLERRRSGGRSKHIGLNEGKPVYSCSLPIMMISLILPAVPIHAETESGKTVKVKVY